MGKKARKKMYFGHPKNAFNTSIEGKLVRIIQKRFPEYLIENPNQPHHQENYREWALEKGNGMLYYFEVVLPKMSAGIFLPFRDGMFGAGVFSEACFLAASKKPVYEITVDGKISRLKLDSSRALSIEETIARYYEQDFL